MTDYERLNHREPVHVTPDPPRWGAVIGAAASAVAVLVVVVGAIWGYAGISYATANIPAIKNQQDSNTRDIAVLKVQQLNGDARFAEIQRQYESISAKLDRLNEQKADKSATKEWVR